MSATCDGARHDQRYYIVDTRASRGNNTREYNAFTPRKVLACEQVKVTIYMLGFFPRTNVREQLNNDRTRGALTNY